VCYLSSRCLFSKEEDGAKSECTSLIESQPSDPEIASAICSAEVIVRLHCRGQRIPSSSSGDTELRGQRSRTQVFAARRVKSRGWSKSGPFVACG